MQCAGLNDEKISNFEARFLKNKELISNFEPDFQNFLSNFQPQSKSQLLIKKTECILQYTIVWVPVQ